MKIKTQRSNIRASVRAKRQLLTLEQQTTASELLLEKLTQHPKIVVAKNIAFYLARDGELNGKSFIEWCWQQNKTVYLPVLHPFSKGQLLFLRYQANTPMQVNSYGLNQPKLDVRLIKPSSEIDIILTPLVAFDSTGNRLGMGGGFYDRTLAQWYKKYQQGISNITHPIGIAHDCQQVPTLPIQQWDIPLPEIITPTQHISNKILT